MVLKEIVSKYQQTLLGPAWYLLQPILTSFVFFFVFTKALGVGTEGVPPVLFYLSGLLAWNYVSQTLNATSMALISNASLFKRVYFPRVMVPLSQTLAFLFTLAFQFLVFLAFYAAYGIQGAAFSLGKSVFFLPLCVLQLCALALGLGLWVSSLTVRYRDFHHLMSFALMLWMYASPIAYSSERIPEEYRWAIELNPLVPSIGLFRHAFFGVGEVSLNQVVLSGLLTGIILFTGFIYFHRVERTLIDKI